MKVGYLITGRLKSIRLPKKLLLEIKGRPIISHMIDRLKLAEQLDEIVICTSSNEQDRPLANIAKQNGIQCYFGDPDDVLVRLLGAADKFNLDYILNITADCPFVDPEYADKIVEEFIKTNADLIRQFDLPHGVFSYGIKVDALRAVVELKDTTDTEVWGGYFVDTGLFNVLDLDVENKKHKRPGLRMTLDYQEDFEFFKAVFNELYVENKVFSLTEILDLLDRKPKIIDINKGCGQKFKKKLTFQSKLKLKRGKKVTTALVIGAGSIGQRHIRNLRKIGIDTIIALRSKKGHHKKLSAELRVIEVDSWDDVSNYNPDIAIISNPSSLHLEMAIRAAKLVKGVFIEKPLSHSLSGTQQLIDRLKADRVVSFVGYNLMFHPIVKNIIKFYDENDIGEIVNFQCQVGQWLPDWHPYEDYKKAYYARKDLGGGVALTMIHEIHLVIELAGLPLHVFGEISHYEQLNLDVDVCSDLLIKHKTGAISQIHLDYLQQPAHRSGVISFTQGWMSYDFNRGELVAQLRGGLPVIIWSDSKYNSNQMYIEQMQEFVRYVEEGRMSHKFDLPSSVEDLKVVDAHFTSSKSGKKVEIERNERFSF